MTELVSTQCPAWYEGIMQPLAGDNPCGESLEYDPAFIMLQGHLQPKLDAEYGDFVEVAESTNWSEIERNCQQLMMQAKDIRLIITLMRCRLRQIGVHALSEGFEALLFALEQWPEALHPQLLDEGEFDPLLRANAFAELESIEGFLADFRQSLLPKAAGLQITIRDAEKANASPREEDALPISTFSAIQDEWLQQQESAIISLQHALILLRTLHEKLAHSLADDAPDFTCLFSILGCFSVAKNMQEAEIPVLAESTNTGKQAESPETGMTAASDITLSPPPFRPDNPKLITNRKEALVQLREIRLWFTDKEPGNPIVPLLAFSEQIIGKSFVELLQLLPQDLISQITTKTETA
ncbi:ImpA family type VI secretion system protein [Enterobacteriaceae bacterium LUAb1]